MKKYTLINQRECYILQKILLNNFNFLYFLKFKDQCKKQVIERKESFFRLPCFLQQHTGFDAMNKYFEKVILESTNSKEIVEIHEIQDLWGGYGKIFRCILSRSLLKSVIVKNVRLPDKRSNQDSDISYKES